MNRNIKAVVSFALALCCLFFVGCDVLQSIVELEITAPVQLELLIGDTSEDADGVRVTGMKDWQLSDVTVVIEDPTIVAVEYEKSVKSAMFIGFKIVALKAGSTRITFETRDGRVKSNPMTVTVSHPFSSIELLENAEIFLNGLTDTREVPFEVKKDGVAVSCPDDLIFVSDDPSVVTVAYATDEDGADVCLLTPVSYGDTYVSVQSSDGEISSERIKVTVTEPADFILNISTKKIHYPTCHTIKNMNPENRKAVYGSADSYLDDGYTHCNTCFK